MRFLIVCLWVVDGSGKWSELNIRRTFSQEIGFL